MKKIIDPIDRGLLESELSSDKFIRTTNVGNREIYIITQHNSPNVMLEIGRLREESFRQAGGGTSLEVDIDEFDIQEIPYKQLVIWSPEDKEIIGGYRFIEGSKIKFDTNGIAHCATGELFKFSEKFFTEYFPVMIELGRSFVQPKYQPTVNIKKGFYSLDNLWDGLGAIIVTNPHIKYYFGKVTMYSSFNVTARDLILYFLQKYFPDPDYLLRPFHPIDIVTNSEKLESILSGETYEKNYRLLIMNVRKLGEQIPPMVNAYMNLSKSMKTFGTAINPSFGGVEETGIMITIEDIVDIKKQRYMNQK